MSEDTNVIETLPLQLNSHLTLFRTAAKSLAKVNYRQCLEITPLWNIAREMTTTDTSLMCTLGSVSVISVLRRCDSNTDTSVMQTLGSVPLISLLRRCDSNTDTYVMWTLGTVSDILIEEL